MKNIAHTLCMLLLFGILCPSYQAYANGKEIAITLEKQQNRAKLNEDLVDRLANSKTFLLHISTLYNINSSINHILMYKNEKEINDIKNNIEDLRTTNPKNINNNIVFDKIGFKVSKNTNEIITEQKKKLISEFPDLFLLDQAKREEIIIKAIEKGDILSKALMFLGAKEVCYQTADNVYAGCATSKLVLAAVAIAGATYCIKLSLACAVAVPLAAPAYIALAGVCIAAAASFVGVLTISSNCTTAHKNEIDICVSKYGSLIGEGAN